MTTPENNISRNNLSKPKRKEKRRLRKRRRQNDDQRDTNINYEERTVSITPVGNSFRQFENDRMVNSSDSNNAGPHINEERTEKTTIQRKNIEVEHAYTEVFEDGDDEDHAVQISKLRKRGARDRLRNIESEQAQEHTIESQVLFEEDESLNEISRRIREKLRSQSSRPFRRKSATSEYEIDNCTISDSRCSDDPESLWRKCIDDKLSIRSDYFKSEEARMLLTTTVRSGNTAYGGLGINVYNCLDLMTVYSDSYLSKELFNSRTARRQVKDELPNQWSESWKQVLCVAGQFMRWSIVRKKIRIYDGWKENCLFDCIADEKMVTTFIEYFRLRCSASTVNAKTIHMRTICRSAKSRCGNNLIRKETLEIIYSYLSKSGTACKQFERSSSGRKNHFSSREAVGKVLLPQDFSRFINIAEVELDKIINSVNEDTSSNPRHKPTFLFHERAGMVKSWNINFIALLILLAGGQRPQVFHQLQAPNLQQTNLWTSTLFSNRYIELDTVCEKRTRGNDVPHVIFPKRVAKYISFHTTTVRPFIMEKHNVMDEEDDCPLLIHTENGDYLDTAQVTRTLRLFLTTNDPELKNLTTMCIRASYATMMFRAHRDGDIFTHLNESQFLHELGKMMNTSLDQLRETYVLCGTLDYTETATQIAQFLDDISMKERREPATSDIDRRNDYELEQQARCYFY